MLTFLDNTPTATTTDDGFRYTPAFEISRATRVTGWSLCDLAEIVSLLVIRGVAKSTIELTATGIAWSWVGSRFELDAHRNGQRFTLTTDGEKATGQRTALAALSLGWDW